MTVGEAFREFKSSLELPDSRQKEAASAQEQLRAAIASYLYVPSSFLTGSYSRYTKIDPLNDIDVFLVRNDRPTELAVDGSGVLPGQALQEIENAVVQAVRGARVQRQSRSVNVHAPGISFGFDLVPAWLRVPNGYWIPDVDGNHWLATDPKAHAEILTRANAASKGMLKPVIKMVKHWSRNNLDLLRSFHIELICVDIFDRRLIPTYQHGVAIALQQLPVHVTVPMSDPVYGESRIDRPLSQDERSRLLGCLSHDGAAAARALEFEGRGDHWGAIREWEGIFMTGFPS
ncbi:MAG: hypothetical protein OEQ75_13660 [Gemmatimonadota bacterium]|nr:hypothetical protein [Gemmatimonadota bacterium]